MSTGPRLASTGQRAGAILPVKDEGRQTMSPANSVGGKIHKCLIAELNG